MTVNLPHERRRTYSSIIIKPFDHSPAHYEQQVGIWNAVHPYQPGSVAFERRRDAHRDPARLFQRYLIEGEQPDGSLQCVGYAEYGHADWTYDPHKFVMAIYVHPAHRKRGYGSCVYEVLMGQVRARAAHSITAIAREDDNDSRKFLRARGFHQIARHPESELDAETFDPSPYASLLAQVQSRGIKIITLGEALDHHERVLPRLYELVREVQRDVPWFEEVEEAPFDIWVQEFEANPDLMLDGYFIAVHGQRFVGLSELWASAATDSILYTGLTGVLASYRHQGIATAMKVRAATYAKGKSTQAGRAPRVRTDNDESNPMLQINLRLGFRENRAWLTLVKKLDTV